MSEALHKVFKHDYIYHALPIGHTIWRANIWIGQSCWSWKGFLQTNNIANEGSSYRDPVTHSNSLHIPMQSTTSLRRLILAIGGPIFFVAGSVHRSMILASGCEKDVGDTAKAVHAPSQSH